MGELPSGVELCVRCQRPEFLWGGPTCDQCDTDANGALDTREVVMSTAGTAGLFQLPEKGWRLIGQSGVVNRPSKTILKERAFQMFGRMLKLPLNAENQRYFSAMFKESTND